MQATPAEAGIVTTTRRSGRELFGIVHRVAEQIDNFSLLRDLTAFQQVEHQVATLRQNGTLSVLGPDA